MVDFNRFNNTNDIYNAYVWGPLYRLWNDGVDSGQKFMIKKSNFADELDRKLDHVTDLISPSKTQFWISPMLSINSYLSVRVVNFFAKGVVDLLRIGDGIQKGDAWGLISDGLRVIGIIGVAGTVVRTVGRSARLMRNALTVVDDLGKDASHILSGAQALIQTGRKKYAAVSNLVDEAFPWDQAAKQVDEFVEYGSRWEDLIQIFHNLGLKVKPRTISSFRELERVITPGIDGIMVVEVERSFNIVQRLTRKITGINDTKVFNVFKSPSGELTIMYRDKLFKNIDDLAHYDTMESLNAMRDPGYLDDVTDMVYDFQSARVLTVLGLSVKLVEDTIKGIIPILCIPILGILDIVEKKTNRKAEIVVLQGE